MSETANHRQHSQSLCYNIGLHQRHQEETQPDDVRPDCQPVFYGASSIVLQGYSSTAQNIVAVFRNFAAAKNVKSRVLEWILIVAGVVLGVVLNNRGLLGLLPIVANLEYSIAVFRFKDNQKALKLSFILNMIMYAAFSLVIMNYVGVASCSVIAVTTAVSLIKEKG